MLPTLKLICVAIYATLALAIPAPLQIEHLTERQVASGSVVPNLGPNYSTLRGNIAFMELRLTVRPAAQASLMEKIAWIGTAQASLKAVVDDFSTLQNELKATEIKNLQSNARTRAVWLGAMAKDAKELFVAMETLAVNLRAAYTQSVPFPQLRTSIRDALSLIERNEMYISAAVTDSLARLLKVNQGSITSGPINY